MTPHVSGVTLRPPAAIAGAVGTTTPRVRTAEAPASCARRRSNTETPRGEDRTLVVDGNERGGPRKRDRRGVAPNGGAVGPARSAGWQSVRVRGRPVMR